LKFEWKNGIMEKCKQIPTTFQNLNLIIGFVSPIKLNPLTGTQMRDKVREREELWIILII
jgi:hypothetical protein